MKRQFKRPSRSEVRGAISFVEAAYGNRRKRVEQLDLAIRNEEYEVDSDLVAEAIQQRIDDTPFRQGRVER